VKGRLAAIIVGMIDAGVGSVVATRVSSVLAAVVVAGTTDSGAGAVLTDGRVYIPAPFS
jgi:hypothetical protein